MYLPGEELPGEESAAAFPATIKQPIANRVCFISNHPIALSSLTARQAWSIAVCA